MLINRYIPNNRKLKHYSNLYHKYYYKIINYLLNHDTLFYPTFIILAFLIINSFYTDPMYRDLNINTVTPYSYQFRLLNKKILLFICYIYAVALIISSILKLLTLNNRKKKIIQLSLQSRKNQIANYFKDFTFIKKY